MQKKSSFQTQLHLPTLGLFRANLRVQHHLRPLAFVWTRKSVYFMSVQLTSLLLISPRPAKVSNFFVRVQLCLTTS